MFKTIFRIFLHEVLGVFKVNAVMSILITGSVLYFFYYPIPYDNEEVREAPTVVVDQDNSTLSREIIRNLDATDSINVIGHVSTMHEAEHMMRNREVYAILWVPFNFEQDALSGRSAALSYYGDASYVIIYSKISSAVQSVVRAMSQKIGANRQIQQGVDPAIAQGNSAPITPVIVPLYNPQSGYATYIIPPVYVLIVYQCLFIAVMLSVILTRRSEFDQSLVADQGTSPFVIAFYTLVGKWLAYLLISGLIFMVYMGITPIFYQLPFHGTIRNLFFIGFVFLSGTIFLGILMGQFFRKFDDIFLIVMPSSMLVFFLSGMSWPKEMIPDGLYFVRYILPVYPAITSMITLNQMDGTLENVRPELNNMIILMGTYSLLALWALRRYYKRLMSSIHGN